MPWKKGNVKISQNQYAAEAAEIEFQLMHMTMIQSPEIWRDLKS